LTLYSTSNRPEDGVLIVYGDFDSERLVTLAKAANEYESTPYGGHVIHSWIDEHKKGKGGLAHRTYGAIQGPRVIFGQQLAAVKRALDVLGGTAASLAGADEFPQLGAPGDTSLVEGAAHSKMAAANSDPKAAIFGLSKTIRLQVGETHEQVAATLMLEAKDVETAGQIASIAQGLVALATLQQNKPEAQKLAQALALKKDGASVIATLTLPDSDVIAFLKAETARKAARKSRSADSAEDNK
jgi:hypothetical protein